MTPKHNILPSVRRPAVVAGVAVLVILAVWLFLTELEPLLNTLLHLGGGDD